MIHLARGYWNLGQWKCADDLQILALEKQRGLFGEENDERMMAMRDLAIIYHNQGHHKEAKKVHTSALEKYRQILGGNHPETLVTMGALGENYRTMAQPEEAEYLCGTVLEKRRKLLGEHHPVTLKSMSSLAVAIHRFRPARECKRPPGCGTGKAERTPRRRSSGYPDTMGRLVATFNQLGWFEVTEEIALVGEDYPNTQWIMGNLAKTYQMQESAWTYHDLDKIQVAEELERLLEIKSTRHENKMSHT
ncbi:hypothetical protein K438DRAFT_1864123 [Mycena galopus ATCC 62051]|nr:hypothetical protein K438DRAFT_1864123 [Mycena galopus ATCC 62051]